MAEPARKIRNVETTEDVVRPRDAAIRQAANDNRKNYIRYTNVQKQPRGLTYENDNPPSSHPTVNESFNEYADGRTIQPTNNPNSATRNTRVEYQKTPPTRTPFIAGTVRGRNPRQVKPTLKRALPNVPVLDVNPVKLAKATSASISNISWGTTLWLFIQLPIALFAIAFLGVAYIIKGVIPEMIKDVTGDFIYNGLTWLASSATSLTSWLSEKIIGFDITALAQSENYFLVANFLVFIIGFMSLVLMGIIYQISFINCVLGKRSVLKISALIFATFAYMVPVLNLFPWFIPWVLVVWRYPE